MKIDGVIIRDEKANKFFGFVRQFPGVCAQADSFEEVKSKVSKHWDAFIERTHNEGVEFEVEQMPSL